VPSGRRTVVPYLQMCAVVRPIPTSRHAADTDQPSPINSMNRRRASDNGRRPGPFFTRRLDNEALWASHIALTAGNHPLER
jgi:hypothetical protein